MIDIKNIPLGAIPSPEDTRDFVSTAIIPQDTAVPAKYSYKSNIQTILNQGQYGICVGCAGADMKNIQEALGKDLPVGGLSPLYLYTLCKQIDGMPSIEGTYPRVALQVLAASGILPYADLPISYLAANGGKLPTITPEQITKATPYKISTYAQVPLDIASVKQALVTQGPLMITIGVANAFYYPEQGKFVGKPSGTFYGSHEVLVVSYDDDMTYTFSDGYTEKGFIEIQNSWDKTWGNGGYAYIPYSCFSWVWGANNYPFVFEIWSSMDFTPQPVQPEYWRIQTGAFSSKTNAQAFQAQLKLKGLPTYLVFIGNLWKVQLGAFLSETNCRNESARIKTLGVDNFVLHY